MYGVLKLIENVGCEVMGMKTELSLNWHEGQMGVIPVFKDYESALKLVDGDETRVFKLQEVEKGSK